MKAFLRLLRGSRYYPVVSAEAKERVCRLDVTCVAPVPQCLSTYPGLGLTRSGNDTR